MDAAFKINGEEFQIPDLVTLTLDESMVFYEYTSLTVADVAEIEGTPPPGVFAALLHISISRVYPTRSKKQIRRDVGGVNLVELLSSFDDADPDEGDALPPASAPEESSSSNDQTGSSGPTSNGTGESSPVSKSLASIGHPGSATTSPESP